MQDIAKLNNIVGKLSKLDDVTTVFAASRAGVFAMGMTPKMTDRAMFSAITSMMLGAAEQIGREMGDELGYMALHLNDSNLLILGAGNKHLVGLVLIRNCNLEKIIADAKTIIANG